MPDKLTKEQQKLYDKMDAWTPPQTVTSTTIEIPGELSARYQHIADHLHLSKAELLTRALYAQADTLESVLAAPTAPLK